VDVRRGVKQHSSGLDAKRSIRGTTKKPKKTQKKPKKPKKTQKNPKKTKKKLKNPKKQKKIFFYERKY
jgi:hypothetical protein